MDYGFLWYVIVAVLLLEWGWDQALEGLNRKSWAAHVPERLKDVFPEDKFQKQKDYRRVNHSFSLINSVTSLLLILVVLFLHGFGWLMQDLKILACRLFGIRWCFWGWWD